MIQHYPQFVVTGLQRVKLALEQLSQQRFQLFLILLFLNALSRPYACFIHDSMLYGLQVANHVSDGSFSQDLFLRYGSQDQYSLFSTVVSPLAELLGVPATFFLLYLLCKALILWAAIGLVQRLCTNRTAATLALFVLAVHPIYFGSLLVFSVNEPFLTARLISVALLLLGLERILNQQYLVSFLLMLSSCLLHPIMGVGGLGLLLFAWLCQRLTVRQTILVTGLLLLAGLGLCLYAPLGERLFGVMDEDWFHYVELRDSICYPALWTLDDWSRVACWVGILLSSVVLLAASDPAAARLLAITCLVGLSGIAASWVAGNCHYALLLQAQFYRASWVAVWLQIPMAFVLAAHLWQRQNIWSTFLAVVLICWLDALFFSEIFLYLLLYTFPVAVVLVRGLGRQPKQPNWWGHALLACVLLAMAGSQCLKLGLVLVYMRDLPQSVISTGIYRLLAYSFSATVWMAWAALAAVWLTRHARAAQRWPAFALTAAAGFQLLFFAVPTYLGDNPHQEDVRYVSAELQRRWPARTSHPTIFWPSVTFPTYWHNLHADCYFHFVQTAGIMFHRETCFEGLRRARLVGRFQIEAMQRLPPPMRGDLSVLHPFYLIVPEQNQVRTIDLLHLCQESKLDFVVLDHKFDGLYAATNGSVYIYDCRQVCALLNQQSPSTVQTAQAPLRQHTSPSPFPMRSPQP